MVSAIQVDARELATQITLTVTHVRQVAWRTRLAGLLIALARRIAPFHLDIESHIGKPWLYYCPYCGRDFCSHYVPEWNHMTVQCPHCNRQAFVLVDEEGAHATKDPGSCDLECAYTEPFGFVPEDGCPVHD